MKIMAIIQARMGSTRLPGKVLKQVLGRPLLAYQIERVNRSKWIDECMVATTDQIIDDPIVSLCQAMAIPYYRGSEDDVLKRYEEAARQAKADVVIRLTGDCPLIDSHSIDQVVAEYLLHDHALQYVSNTLNRTFPRGMDTEVFSYRALKEADEKAESKADREHVTRYIVNHPEYFTLLNVARPINASRYRLTIDTSEDYELIRKIIEALYPLKPNFTLEDVIHLLEKNPDWPLINRHVQQKKD
ncbi:MAG: glycosyltransferase family protein [Sporolactobacillus sp.]